MLLDKMLKAFIQVGNLNIVDHKGKKYHYSGRYPSRSTGSNHATSATKELNITIELHNKEIERALFWQPELALGEGYMDGTITLKEGSVVDLLDLCTRNLQLMNEPQSSIGFSKNIMSLFSKMINFIRQNSPIAKSKQNVEHHYDLNGDFYKLFLDADQQYSCAYFKNNQDSLEMAQLNKKQHIANKLLIADGQKILDIGSGWGGMALYLASLADVEVHGLTLSKEQYAVATERAKKAGLSDRVIFHLKDYRETEGQFDRIVSVGMFEHVGLPQYHTFFKNIHHLLSPKGIMLLHSIGSSGLPRMTNPWIQKYIFPGGYCPSLSEVLPLVEKTRLHITDIEILRYHYAETLKAWRERFNNNIAQIKTIYDERFCRMWEFYLACCEMGFRNQELMVFQMQLVKDKSVIPLTRDYMYSDDISSTQQLNNSTNNQTANHATKLNTQKNHKTSSNFDLTKAID